MTSLEQIFENVREKSFDFGFGVPDIRISYLKKLKSSLLEHREEILKALHTDLKKHPIEAELTEFLPSIQELKFAIKNLKSWMKPQKVSSPMALKGTTSYLYPQAKGCVLILSPWNYPFQLALIPLISAIAAGNTVVLKASENTPATTRVLYKILAEVFPPTHVACIEGGVETAQQLLEFPFNHIFFTGSTNVGREVMKKAAQHLASVTLELGGKSPVIITEDADLEQAALWITWGKFLNLGQTCVAPDYVYVPKHLEERLVELVKEKIQILYGASSEERKSSSALGRLIHSRHFSHITKLAQGLKATIGGESDAKDLYFEPTILQNVKPESAILKEEIFGPLLPILAYDNLVKVIRDLQKEETPLALYIFTNKKETWQKIVACTRAGGTAVNGIATHLLNPNLPFGGVGASGSGRYHGKFGFDEFTHYRAVLVNGSVSSTKLFVPPYTSATEKTMSLVRKFLY